MTLKENLPEQALDLETIRKYMSNPEYFLVLMALQSLIKCQEKTIEIFKGFLASNEEDKTRKILKEVDDISREIMLGIRVDITPNHWIQDNVFTSGSSRNNNQIIN